MKSNWLARLESVVLVTSAVTLTGVFVHRELRSERTPATSAAVRTVKEWRTYGSSGHRIGPTNAPVTIIEFADFQCPFCAALHTSVRTVLAEHPRDVALIYRHFPITQLHPHAMGAAIAAECAADQERFEAFSDLLFENQKAIGERSWIQFAADAEVADTTRFARCVVDSVPLGRIRKDMRDATALGVTGTPALLINERFIAGAPSLPMLERYVSEALERNQP